LARGAAPGQRGRTHPFVFPHPRRHPGRRRRPARTADRLEALRILAGDQRRRRHFHAGVLDPVGIRMPPRHRVAADPVRHLPAPDLRSARTPRRKSKRPSPTSGASWAWLSKSRTTTWACGEIRTSPGSRTPATFWPARRACRSSMGSNAPKNSAPFWRAKSPRRFSQRCSRIWKPAARASTCFPSRARGWIGPSIRFAQPDRRGNSAASWKGLRGRCSGAIPAKYTQV
jgi:hypothetical protein